MTQNSSTSGRLRRRAIVVVAVAVFAFIGVPFHLAVLATPFTIAAQLVGETGVGDPVSSTASPASPRGEARRTLTPTPTPTPTPSVIRLFDTTIEEVPFEVVEVGDENLDSGVREVRSSGTRGVIEITYSVTLVNGKETNRVETDRRILKSPVDEIVAVGTRVPQPAPAPPAAGDCHPSYSGACVPVTSDVDCGGGSGDGPGYVWGPVTVVGPDVYRLDRDGDGIACDR